MATFLDALEKAPLLFDGAMGSLLYERGVFLTRSYDALNLSQPGLVRSVHRDYLEAGAGVIETNTFGANRLALAKHGRSDETLEINRAGVQLAREVAGDRALVAGAVGPTGVSFAVASDSDRKLARDALVEQIQALVEAGVDLLCLETFLSIVELEQALAIRKEIAPDTPVVAMLVFEPSGLSQGGLSPEEVADRLKQAGADVVGANCGSGPPELYEVATKMVGRGRPVAIMPNAGLPSIVERRTIYVANPEHFGVFARRMLKAGVRVIGGCCGTTPEHTRSMLGAVRMMGSAEAPPEAVPVPLLETSSQERSQRTVPPPHDSLADRSKLGARIEAGEFAVSVELKAPAGSESKSLIAKVKECQAAGIDIINIADGPRASARMGNLAACATALSETGIESILHVCCRDRNYLGLVSHLLGAHALGIRNLVIITGDPPKMGDYPFATPVYDVDSVGLLRMVAGLNAGIDPAGKELDGQTSFVLATGAEPAASDYERELRRVEAKAAAGADLIMTQPVYNPETLDRFLADVEPLGLPVMVGLLPLASHRNAEFLHNEVPGMQIPQAYRERMAGVDSGAPARAEGVRIAREALDAVKDRVAGAYIMPPFDRVESAVAVLDVVRGNQWNPSSADES